ncbi:MAG TPA: hypothetical protein VFW96_04685, partial [Thermomicrobiales bacterium]|nr:hypothetical protein [Thermomicrobiales bacterium]
TPCSRAPTVRKTVWMTEEAIACVQAWADAQGITFSAAVEALARLGMRQAPAEAVAPALVSAVRQEIRGQARRIAGLLAASAIEAGTASRGVNVLLREAIPDKGSAIARGARLAAVEAIRGNKALKELGLGDQQGELHQGQ